MNQTMDEYLDAQYGKCQQSIQAEFDWVEKLLVNGPQTVEFECPECGDSDNWIEVADGYTGCGCSY